MGLGRVNCLVSAQPLTIRGARRTVTGVGRTHTVGLRLRGCCSRSRRYFVKACKGNCKLT